MEFRAVDLDALATGLRAFAGKALLVHHFATWCEPCKEELPVLREILEALQPELGFTTVAISWDLFMAPVPPEYATEEVRKFLARRQMTFDHVWIYTGQPDELFRSQGITAGTVPFTDVRDGQGALLAKFPAPILDDEDRERLRRALHQSVK